MNIHFIIHESFEGPAAILTWAEKNNHQTRLTRLAMGEQLPASCNEFDFLIIMGGPQSPATSLAECPHFNAEAEINLIKATIAANKHVLGICLGAQLLGEACGGTFEHSPEKEIGAFDITLTAAGLADPLFADFPTTFPVGHWHGDMPGLNDHATLLAYSAGCPRQIINYAPRAYGFQCHFELTLASVQALINKSAQELSEYADAPYVWSATQLTQYDYQPMNQLLFKFLDKFITV